METAKLSQKYQIVVPKEVRERLRLHAGSRVEIYSIDEDSALLTKRPAASTQVMKGLGKDVWKRAGGASRYIKQERASWRKK